MGCFLNNSKYDELVDYELILPKQYDLSIKGMCIYHESDFDRLSVEQKQRLIELHSNVIRIKR
jgi:myo-inositol catabolism protein IolC